LAESRYFQRTRWPLLTNAGVLRFAQNDNINSSTSNFF
jgi:hypothetical protein